MLTAMPGAMHFKNKRDNGVKCSCCGRMIYKGYTMLGVNIGEDCYDSILTVFNQSIQPGTRMADFMGIKPMHFDWIASR